jgi:phage recombination protein Bet
MSTALVSLTGKLAQRFDMDSSPELLDTLKATAFKGQVSDAQMTALLIVANQYGLNPWTKEIYAFPDSNNGIVPVVGVDGWARIINEHPQFDGLEFEQTDKECTCIIYRKDRAKPTKVTEYKDECSRDTKPWRSHPKRMLRHKALIQCARLAFGYTGIYDQDEAERIVEGTEKVGGQASGTIIDGSTGEIINKTPPAYSDEEFKKNLPSWRAAIAKGARPDAIIAKVSTKGTLTEEQKAAIRAPTAPAPTAEDLFTQVKAGLEKAQSLDTLDVAADLIKSVAVEQQRAELSALYQQRMEDLT